MCSVYFIQVYRQLQIRSITRHFKILLFKVPSSQTVAWLFGYSLFHMHYNTRSSKYANRNADLTKQLVVIPKQFRKIIIITCISAEKYARVSRISAEKYAYPHQDIAHYCNVTMVFIIRYWNTQQQIPKVEFNYETEGTWNSGRPRYYGVLVRS